MKSISDDDLCSDCTSCNDNPGGLSSCALGFPGATDQDGYIVYCEVATTKAAPEKYRYLGKDFAIAAEFQDTHEGTAQANEFMEANPRTGLLALDAGRIIIAALNDKGTTP